MEWKREEEEEIWLEDNETLEAQRDKVLLVLTRKRGL